MRRAFTLIELLVVIAIIAIITAIVFPVIQSAKLAGPKTMCISNLKQLGLSFTMYMSDTSGDKMPDRRDLKALDYRPWTSWPASDPRAGWMMTVLDPYTRNNKIFACPVAKDWPRNWPQVHQNGGTYWAWRFDRADAVVALDAWWGKTLDEALADAQEANNPTIGKPESTADLELMVDPYFPKTIPSVLPDQKGKAPHAPQRNRLFLDIHVKGFSDARTDR